MATSTIDVAQERMSKAWTASQEAHKAALQASAEYFRLAMLEIAGRNPGLVAFELEVTYEYDDEGGYFASVYATAVVDEENSEQQRIIEEEGHPEDEVQDLGLDAETAALLTDNSGDSTWQARISVARLQELKFA